MTMTDPQAPGAGLKNLIAISSSSLRDTFSSRSHSKDFAFARGDYLRNRVMVICGLFLVLLPFWAALDWFLLPIESHNAAIAGRGLMLGALFLTYLLARHSKARLQWARLSAGLVLGIPAAFYALVLASLPAGGVQLIGYSFIPYMLVAMLAIFPFTLLESAVLGTALILLELYALHVGGTLLSAAGLQDAWLLAALLSIAITANYFQLGLMLRLYREATHDPLTGLLNRGALRRALDQLVTLETGPRASLLMMDLDHFKRINDTYGHAFGDDVLRHFASILRGTLRSTDLIARYGGEEFVAVLPNADKDAALKVAERIRQQTEAAVLNDYNNTPVHYTVSIGVATLQPGEPFHAAAMRADNRLYEAKKTTRNCVVGV
ncbi:MAG TPA: GGDEF domain-containing protein [Burkholderiaceae bacterium]|jgi:diguanylate cyclase (GGDEF)-like protein|nr:GGDEF domain-containing protein [Burkholderiaceae bacterium]